MKLKNLKVDSLLLKKIKKLSADKEITMIDATAKLLEYALNNKNVVFKEGGRKYEVCCNCGDVIYFNKKGGKECVNCNIDLEEKIGKDNIFSKEELDDYASMLYSYGDFGKKEISQKELDKSAEILLNALTDKSAEPLLNAAKEW